MADEIQYDVTILSKIESNKIEPNWQLYNTILYKYGIDPRESYNLWAITQDYDTYKSILQVKKLLVKNELEKAGLLIDKLEKEKEFAGGLSLQFLLVSKVKIAVKKADNPDEIIKLTTKALLSGREEFIEEDIDRYFLSKDEVTLLNTLAVAYADSNNIDRAAFVLSKLKDSIERSFVHVDDRPREYPLVLHHLAKYLSIKGQHQSVIDICQYARGVCIRGNNSYYLPDILVDYAKALYATNDLDMCKKYLMQAQIFFKATDRFEDSLYAENLLKEYFKQR